MSLKQWNRSYPCNGRAAMGLFPPLIQLDLRSPDTMCLALPVSPIRTEHRWAIIGSARQDGPFIAR